MNWTYVKVKVNAGAKKESIAKMKSGYLVCVREKAERNLANARVIELLARTLGVQKSSVRIVKGHHTPAKLFAVPSDLF